MAQAAAALSTEFQAIPFDPIYGALDRYHKAEEAYWMARRLEEARTGSTIWPGNPDHPALNRLADTWERQRDRLRNTTPRTLAGAVALAETILESTETIESDLGEGGETLPLIRGLYQALVTFAAGGAQ
jgi:hypothetical protein